MIDIVARALLRAAPALLPARVPIAAPGVAMSRSMAAALLLACCLSAAAETRLLRHPTVSRDLIAFAYAGDLWTVPRSGGQARRITSTPGVEGDPFFAPDGSQIAYTATVAGNTDVYVVPAAGGESRRLTWHPGL